VRILVVLPTYQEADNIVEVLTQIRASAPDVDVLVVDDSSPDGTADLARGVNDELGQIDVLVRPVKDGLGNAVRAGLTKAMERGYDIAVQMDADLSHDPAALPSIYAKVVDGSADATIGSRYVPGGSIPHWPWHRRMMSKWGNWYTCLVLGITVHDATSGFRAARVTTLEAIDVLNTRAKGYGFQIESAYRIVEAGQRLSEVPITFTDRVRGNSKMSLGVAVEELILVTWWGVRDRSRKLFKRSSKG
jgi:dolichol-phosphate mannosyltransferase